MVDTEDEAREIRHRIAMQSPAVRCMDARVLFPSVTWQGSRLGWQAVAGDNGEFIAWGNTPTEALEALSVKTLHLPVLREESNT